MYSAFLVLIVAMGGVWFVGLCILVRNICRARREERIWRRAQEQSLARIEMALALRREGRWAEWADLAESK